MYVRISKKKSGDKTYEYLQLCESKRNEKGQPRVNILANFGRLDQLDRKKIDSAVESLLVFSSNPHPGRLDDLEHDQVRDYGDMLALAHIWGRLRLTEMITRHTAEQQHEFSVADLVQVMVLNRASDPLSKLGVLRWLETVLIPELKTDGIAYQHLLRAMDSLIGIKEQLEKDLYNQLLTLFSPRVDLVFYDITSSYFEGEGPECAEYGYSRDHRPDRKQLVLALAVTREGLPIYHEVLPGNTADVSTLQEAVRILSKRFNIGTSVIVCDRGMISKENVAFLEEHGFPYILALRPRNNAEAEELYQKSLAGFTAETSLNGLLVKEKDTGSHRYIQCHNPKVAADKKQRRTQRVGKIEQQTTALNVRHARGSLSGKELYHQVRQLIEQYHMTPFYDPRLEAGKVILYRHTAIWEREEYLDGKFFLKTNLPASSHPTAEVVATYKQLQTVERAFRELKGFIKLRPMYHYTDERVKAHVFICVLAYLLERIIELECRELPQVTSARRALGLLSRLKAIECRVGRQLMTMTNRVDEQITDILSRLGVPPIGKILETQLHI